MSGDMTFNLPVSVNVLLSYYCIPIIGLLIVYVIGWAIKYLCFRVRENVSAFSILTCSVLGLSAIVTIYSIVMTKGLTVNWILLFLFFIYCCYRKNIIVKPRESCGSSWLTYLFLIALVNVPFYLFYVYRIVDFENGLFSPFAFDLDYYAKVSQFLNRGYENGLLEYNFFKYISPTPYHYFELWTNSLLYRFFDVNAAVSYMVSMPILFDSLIFISLLAIIEKKKKLTFLYVLCAFVVLLLADIIPYLSEIIPMIKGSTYRMDYPKMLPVFLFLFTSCVCYLYRQKYIAYLIFLSIPILNIIPLVAVWGIVGVVLLYQLYIKHSKNWSYWIPFVGALLLFLFYVLQSPSRSTHWGESFHWGLLRLYITQPILYLIAYAHLVLLIFILFDRYFWRIIKKNYVLYFIVCFIVITVSIIMRPFHYDATQFVNGSIPIFIYVIFAFIFLRIITRNLSLLKHYYLFGGCAILLLISVDRYKADLEPWSLVSSGYNAKIINLISEEEEYRIGFYIGENVRLGEGGNYVSGIVDAITIPDILDYYHNNVIHYSINKGNNDVKYSTDETPYRDYYDKRKLESQTLSDDQIRIDFVRENNIRYIRIYKSAIPSEYFLSHLNLLVEDEISGERFYQVK